MCHSWEGYAYMYAASSNSVSGGWSGPPTLMGTLLNRIEKVTVPVDGSVAQLGGILPEPKALNLLRWTL